MTDVTGTIDERPATADEDKQPWFAQTADEVVAVLGADAGNGLSHGEAARRLRSYGPNSIAAEKPPSVWTVALRQVRDPMNIMLVVVVAVSIVLGETPTALIVGLLPGDIVHL